MFMSEHTGIAVLKELQAVTPAALTNQHFLDPCKKMYKNK
jgi:hypothetical protein